MTIETMVKNYRYHYKKEMNEEHVSDFAQRIRRLAVGLTREEMLEGFAMFLDTLDKELANAIKDYMEQQGVSKLESPAFGKVELRTEYKAHINKEDFHRAAYFLKLNHPDTNVVVEYRLKPSTQAEEEAIMGLPIPMDRKPSIHWKHLNSIVKSLMEESGIPFSEIHENGIHVNKEKTISVNKIKEN